jgi:uncharacterized protein DUF6931
MTMQGNGKLGRTAAEICRDITFRGKGRELLREDLTAAGFFDLLVEREQFSDAIRFLAHVLPKRLAVWWGCLCLWHVSRPAADAKLAAVLEAATRWVLEPSESNRRAAEQPGRAAGLDTPAGCLGMAVFWSDGSMGRADLPPIPPPETLTAKTVAGSILMAAALSGGGPVRTRCRRQFVAMGREVAEGTALWFDAARIDQEANVVISIASEMEEPVAAGMS